jgi:hypothetical protein
MITDEFSDLKVSRQRKYQLRHKNIGLCRLCSKEAVNAHYCQDHTEKAQARSKTPMGPKKAWNKHRDGGGAVTMGEQCYDLRNTGISWAAIAQAFNSSTASCASAASFYARKNNLPPISKL